MSRFWPASARGLASKANEKTCGYWLAARVPSGPLAFDSRSHLEQRYSNRVARQPRFRLPQPAQLLSGVSGRSSGFTSSSVSATAGWRVAQANSSNQIGSGHWCINGPYRLQSRRSRSTKRPAPASKTPAPYAAYRAAFPLWIYADRRIERTSSGLIRPPYCFSARSRTRA